MYVGVVGVGVLVVGAGVELVVGYVGVLGGAGPGVLALGAGVGSVELGCIGFGIGALCAVTACHVPPKLLIPFAVRFVSALVVAGEAVQRHAAERHLKLERGRDASRPEATLYAGGRPSA